MNVASATAINVHGCGLGAHSFDLLYAVHVWRIGNPVRCIVVNREGRSTREDGRAQPGRDRRPGGGDRRRRGARRGHHPAPRPRSSASPRWRSTGTSRTRTSCWPRWATGSSPASRCRPTRPRPWAERLRELMVEPGRGSASPPGAAAARLPAGAGQPATGSAITETALRSCATAASRPARRPTSPRTRCGPRSVWSPISPAPRTGGPTPNATSTWRSKRAQLASLPPERLPAAASRRRRPARLRRPGRVRRARHRPVHRRRAGARVAGHVGAVPSTILHGGA